MDPNALGYTPAVQPGPLLPPNASLVRAWATLARRPSRRAFSAWAPAANRRWIFTSLVLAEALHLATSSISALRHVRVPSASSATGYLFGVPSTEERIFYALTAVPVTQVAVMLAVPYAVALVMPPTHGAIGARFEQVLRPWALAQVISGAASLVLGVATVGLDVANHSPPSLASCASLLVILGAGVYSLAAEVNALSAGSGRGRWMVFGLALLASVIVSAVLVYIPAAIAYYAFGFHLFPV